MEIVRVKEERIMVDGHQALTVPQVAKHAGLTRDAIYKAIYASRLPCIRDGAKRYVLLTDAETFWQREGGIASQT